MKWLVDPLRTLATLAVGVVATVLGAPAVILIARRDPRSAWIERIARGWSKAWLTAAGSPLKVRGREHVEPGRSYVVVANHLSNLDIMACLLAVPLPIRFLAKKELFRVPLLAPAMRAVGVVEVDRVARAAIHQQVNVQARQVVERGQSLIIYPEGTRSRDGTLRPFKKGAFTMAVAAQMPVLPVTIHGSYRAWPPGQPIIRGGPITVVIDPPIPTEGLGPADTSTIRDEARKVIAGRLAELNGRP
ncbi:MAG: lysophospholipid acyltransferase family protein [Acidimicrobiia bacterium]